MTQPDESSITPTASGRSRRIRRINPSYSVLSTSTFAIRTRSLADDRGSGRTGFGHEHDARPQACQRASRPSPTATGRRTRAIARAAAMLTASAGSRKWAIRSSRQSSRASRVATGWTSEPTAKTQARGPASFRKRVPKEAGLSKMFMLLSGLRGGLGLGPADADRVGPADPGPEPDPPGEGAGRFGRGVGGGDDGDDPRLTRPQLAEVLAVDRPLALDGQRIRVDPLPMGRLDVGVDQILAALAEIGPDRAGRRWCRSRCS